MTYTISSTAPTVTPKTTSTGSSSSSTGSDAASLTTNYSTFLNLLTAQVKNQDPLSPMDTTQWTNQLVQYSSVEQQLKANQYLATIAANNTSGSMNSAVSYIGKTVSAASNSSMLSNGSATWDYNLGSTAGSATATISDTSGTTVWSGPLSDLDKGDHTFSWDGKNAGGTAQPSGYYNLSVSAKTASGTAIDSTVSLSGTVTSAEDQNGTVMLKIGNSEVPMSTITKVS